MKIKVNKVNKPSEQAIINASKRICSIFDKLEKQKYNVIIKQKEVI